MAPIVHFVAPVGEPHTADAGSSQIAVLLVQIHALTGLLTDALLSLIAESALDESTSLKTHRAFNKLLWIQNDLTSRRCAWNTELATV